MRRFLRNWAILITMIFVILFIGIEITEAQQYITFVGKVVSVQRKVITVEGDKGEVFQFAVGRKTIYIPHRLPGVGERVKVEYLFQRGHNVAYQMKVLPPPNKKK